MVPRSVLMAKAVKDAGVDVELLGNVIAKQYRGWTNNGNNDYYTRNDAVYGDIQGQPTGYLYDVRSYGNPTDGEARWGQGPCRLNAETYSAILYPIADRIVPPPIDNLGP
jgi:hypothetical protein